MESAGGVTHHGYEGDLLTATIFRPEVLRTSSLVAAGRCRLRQWRLACFFRSGGVPGDQPAPEGVRWVGPGDRSRDKMPARYRGSEVPAEGVSGHLEGRLESGRSSLWNWGLRPRGRRVPEGAYFRWSVTRRSPGIDGFQGPP